MEQQHPSLACLHHDGHEQMTLHGRPVYRDTFSSLTDLRGLSSPVPLALMTVHVETGSRNARLPLAHCRLAVIAAK